MVASFAATLIACGAERGSPVRGGTGGTGAGAEGGSGDVGGGAGAGGAPTVPIDFPDRPGGSSGTGGGDQERCGQLIAIVRDFDPKTHEDFETFNQGLQPGLVKPTLDQDRLPVRADVNPSQLKSAESFAQWYRDTPNINQRFDVPLVLTKEASGVFAYQNNAFFPIDGKGFGNSGKDHLLVDHNFHFTTEIRGRFRYQGGEVFTFRGDDDVWVFVNGKLGLDLGGVHGVQTATLRFDDKAAELGIEKGKTYTLDVFHAERHTSASNFRMETSIECLAVE